MIDWSQLCEKGNRIIVHHISQFQLEILLLTRIILRHRGQEIGNHKCFVQKHTQFRGVIVPNDNGQHKKIRNAAQNDCIAYVVDRNQSATDVFGLQRSMAEREQSDNDEQDRFI